jgi:hypothetical protein
MLWFGAAASAVDLNPTDIAGVSYSFATATNGAEQVGLGAAVINGPKEALLWSGSAASAIDLQLLLPATGTWTNSWGTSIDADGNVFGTAEGTFNGVSGYFAVDWFLVPEPASFGVLAVGAFRLLRRRRIMGYSERGWIENL